MEGGGEGGGGEGGGGEGGGKGGGGEAVWVHSLAPALGATP